MDKYIQVNIIHWGLGGGPGGGGEGFSQCKINYPCISSVHAPAEMAQTTPQ